jgi:hypothetical protein
MFVGKSVSACPELRSDELSFRIEVEGGEQQVDASPTSYTGTNEKMTSPSARA